MPSLKDLFSTRYLVLAAVTLGLLGIMVAASVAAADAEKARDINIGVAVTSGLLAAGLVAAAVLGYLNVPKRVAWQAGYAAEQYGRRLQQKAL